MTTDTIRTVLKGFQKDAINNGTAVLSTCLKQLSKLSPESKNYEQNKKLIVSDVGALLFEAPTGTGKTLMAGHVAENISLLHSKQGLTAFPPVLWFWFSPFAGLIDQAVTVIQSEFTALRPKNLSIDREPGDLKSGDVFVTTWSSVAVSNQVSRKARTSTELLPSIDDFLKYARAQGFVIGVIIDEAHHSFRGQTQAFDFYKSVLMPELTILVTATPRDRDIDSFAITTGINNLRRITVSRQQAIEDRLIKEGVKVAVFKAPMDVESLIDFKRTALKQAVATHKRLKNTLKQTGHNVVPLLLVQVDSEAGSVEQAIEWLKELGFRTDGDRGLVRSHTADEPDPYLSVIAADETVEVLVFKMAVATGFDAPRAFTLVSFRPNRDDDFGVQIVGRILRVDRRLQNHKNVPIELNYGYVYLSDNKSQVGLTSAASRINQVKNEMASITSNVSVATLDIQEMKIVNNGTTSFLSIDDEDQDNGKPDHNIQEREVERNDIKQENLTNDNDDLTQDVLFEEWGLLQTVTLDGKDEDSVSIKGPTYYKYPLKTELNPPKVFQRAVLSLNNVDIVRHIVSRFRFDDDALIVAQQSATKIILEEVEIFQNRKERLEEIRADLAQKEIDRRAQLTLLTADDFDVIDMRELYRALSVQFRTILESKGIDHLFDTQDKIRAGMHKILALRPQQLKRAISESVAKYTESKDSEPIPNLISSFEPLDPARLNIYGIFPDDLNSWELSFARDLDNDLTETVLWWHRNPPRKPYSVTLPLPGQPDFYPDFVVGIRGRSTSNGILLMETKRMLNDQEGNAVEKVQAIHPDYGKVMMIYWEQQREWRVVEYDPRTDKNFLDRVLRTELMISY